jgi:hypothetical protein
MNHTSKEDWNKDKTSSGGSRSYFFLRRRSQVRAGMHCSQRLYPYSAIAALPLALRLRARLCLPGIVIALVMIYHCMLVRVLVHGMQGL